MQRNARRQTLVGLQNNALLNVFLEPRGIDAKRVMGWTQRRDHVAALRVGDGRALQAGIGFGHGDMSCRDHRAGGVDDRSQNRAQFLCPYRSRHDQTQENGQDQNTFCVSHEQRLSVAEDVACDDRVSLCNTVMTEYTEPSRLCQQET